jgi:hypothetical protein
LKRNGNSWGKIEGEKMYDDCRVEYLDVEQKEKEEKTKAD